MYMPWVQSLVQKYFFKDPNHKNKEVYFGSQFSRTGNPRPHSHICQGLPGWQKANKQTEIRCMCKRPNTRGGLALWEPTPVGTNLVLQEQELLLLQERHFNDGIPSQEHHNSTRVWWGQATAPVACQLWPGWSVAWGSNLDMSAPSTLDPGGWAWSGCTVLGGWDSFK